MQGELRSTVSVVFEVFYWCFSIWTKTSSHYVESVVFVEAQRESTIETPLISYVLEYTTSSDHTVAAEECCQRGPPVRTRACWRLSSSS